MKSLNEMIKRTSMDSNRRLAPCYSPGAPAVKTSRGVLLQGINVDSKEARLDPDTATCPSRQP